MPALLSLPQHNDTRLMSESLFELQEDKEEKEEEVIFVEQQQQFILLLLLLIVVKFLFLLV